jgi:uncharacterized protein (DUF362 family)
MSSAPVVSTVSCEASYDRTETLHDAVWESLRLLNLPSGFVRRRDNVVIKPNWVKEHDERYPGPDQWEHVVTHPAIIEAVASWAARQMDGDGSITICDGPQTDSSFEKLRLYCGLDGMLEKLRKRFPGITFTLLDLRQEEWQSIDGVVVSKRSQPGDPRGQTHVSLNEASEFIDFHREGRLYGASYDMEETNRRHAGSQHDYLLCRTAMEADVFINLPKLKTHKKVGITCALKNLVGINANKNWLPHHTEGTPEQGGDQFPFSTSKARLEHYWMGAAKRWLKNKPALSRLFIPLKKAGRLYFGDTQRVVRSGNWHGNDTCWRMVLDLNKCLYFYDGEGLQRKNPLRYLAVVDGIVGGEGNAPLAPDPKPAGVVIAGTHPLAIDVVAATIMGFDWQRIRLLQNAFNIAVKNFVPFSASEIRVLSNKKEWAGSVDEMEDVLDFKPHFGWVGAIENTRQAFKA